MSWLRIHAVKLRIVAVTDAGIWICGAGAVSVVDGGWVVGDVDAGDPGDVDVEEDDVAADRNAVLNAPRQASTAPLKAALWVSTCLSAPKPLAPAGNATP